MRSIRLPSFHGSSFRHLLCASTLAITTVASVHAGKPEKAAGPSASEKTVIAEKLLAAYEAEIEGDKTTRDALLDEVCRIDPNCAAARSQQGLLKGGDGEWKTIHEAIAEPTPENFAEYQTKRDQLPDTPAANFDLAKWCEHAKLMDQRRAHLERTIRLAPDHQLARAALGFRRIGNDWVSEEQWRNASAAAKAMRESLHKYGRKLEVIAGGLKNPNSKQFESSLEQLKKIDDADAIPAIEFAFGQANEDVVGPALDWLAARSEPSAAISLANFAVLHENEVVRRMANQRLQNRDLYEYAPHLMQLISSPVQSRLVTWFRPDGGIALRQEFVREGRDQVDTLLVETSVRPNIPGAGRQVSNATRNSNGMIVNPNNSNEVRAKQFAQQQALTRQQTSNQQNAVINDLNQRIATTLSNVSGSTVFSDSESMWKWWDSVNESYRPVLKQVRYTRLNNDLVYDVIPPAPILRQSGECFVKGTPVMTRQGLKAIEKIKAGDLVLSKNTRTGELAWKPVIEATTRDPAPTFLITTANDKLCCTGGHVFWVSGQGWTKASQLKPGDILHGAQEPIQVDAVEEAPVATTHNLVVADNSNYFVGQAAILSHDITPREFERAAIPGQQ